MQAVPLKARGCLHGATERRWCFIVEKEGLLPLIEACFECF